MPEKTVRCRPPVLPRGFTSRAAAQLLTGLAKAASLRLVPSTVPHELVDRNGLQLRTCTFGPAVRWQPGEVVILSDTESYRVLERIDGVPVTLVVEPQ